MYYILIYFVLLYILPFIYMFNNALLIFMNYSQKIFCWGWLIVTKITNCAEVASTRENKEVKK